MVNQRLQAHKLIDCISQDKLSAVVGLLEVMIDPLDRELANAEVDDEPTTEEDRRDIEASRTWFQSNEGTPLAAVMEDLGISIQEVENYKDPAY